MSEGVPQNRAHENKKQRTIGTNLTETIRVPHSGNAAPQSGSKRMVSAIQDQACARAELAVRSCRTSPANLAAPITGAEIFRREMREALASFGQWKIGAADFRGLMALLFAMG